MLALRAEQLQSAIDRLREPLPRFRFGPWVAIRDCQILEDRVVLIFEALQNGVPPLAAHVRYQDGSKWKTTASARLDNQCLWKEGDVRTVHLPLPPHADFDRLGVALFTDVLFHPSMLPLSGAPPNRPFPSLRELQSAFLSP